MALGSTDLELKHSASQLAGTAPVYIRSVLNAAPSDRLRIVDGSFRWREGRATKEEESTQKKALLKKVQAQLENCVQEEVDEKQMQCEEITELLLDAV